MRTVSMLLVLLLALGLSGTSRADAQEEAWADVSCGDLSPSDCAFLRLSALVMDEVQSVSYDAEMAIDVSADVEQFQMTIAMDGVFDVGQDEIDAVTDDILGTTIGQVLTMAEPDGALMETLLGYAERVLTAPSMSMHLHIDANIPDEPEEPIAVDLLFVEGAIYLRAPDMPGVEPGDWLSIDLVQGLHMIAGLLQNPQMLEGVMAGLPMEPSAQGPTTGEGMPDMMGQISTLIEQINEIAERPYWEAMESPEFEAQFVTVSRLPDADVNGVPVAVFETTLDYRALTETAEFQQLMADILNITATTSNEPFPEDMVDVAIEIVASQTTTMTEAIGLDDYYLYEFRFDGAQTIDPVTIMRLAGELPDEDMPVQTTAYQFRLTLSDHNSAPPVEPPEAANVVSVFSMIGMGAGSLPEIESDAEAQAETLVPAGWEETDAGFPGLAAYVGPNGEFFLHGSIPAPTNAVMPILATNMGLEAIPDPVDERDVNGVPWTFYEVDADDEVMFFAVSAGEQPPTHLVVMTGPPETREAYYDSLYMAAVAAAAE